MNRPRRPAVRGARRSLRPTSIAPGFVCLFGWLSAGTAGAEPVAAGSPPTVAAPSDAPASNADARAEVEAPVEADAARAEVEPEAQPSAEALAEARERFDHGLELYADGDFALALIEFRRAYALVPHYRVLFNIGQVSVQLGSYADARRAFEKYLEEGGDQLSDERKSAVRRDLDMLSRRTAFLQVTSNVAGAEVLVDDVVVGTAPLAAPLLVDAGVHRVTLRHHGYSPRSTRVTLAGGDEESLRVSLEKLVQQKETIVVREAVEDDSNALAIAGWVTTGALAAGAIVTGIMGAGEAKELQELKRTNRNDVFNLEQRLESAQTNARSLLLASDVFTGAAAVVGGLSLWVTVAPREPAPTSGQDQSKPGRAALEVGYQQGQIKLRGTF